MNNITTKEEALKQIDDLKKFIDNLDKPRPIMERIKNMSDVYADLGIDEQKFLTDIPYRTIEMSNFARKIGINDLDMDTYPCFLIRDFNIYAMVYVLNEGWLPDYSDLTQRKYYPYFYLSSGFVFGSADCADSSAYTASASRLCFKNSDLAIYAGKTFTPEYKKYTINK